METEIKLPVVVNDTSRIYKILLDSKTHDGILVSQSPSNCKLVYIDHIYKLTKVMEKLRGSEISKIKKDNFKAELLQALRSIIHIKLVFITINHTRHIEYIEEYFDIISTTSYPIGYTDYDSGEPTFQYHIIAKVKNSLGYIEQIERVGIDFKSKFLKKSINN